MLPKRHMSLATLSATTISEPAQRLTAPHMQTAHVLKVRVALCLLLVCLGTIWFADQLWLTPQPTLYAPDWQGASWLQASDGNAHVAYFRRVVALTLIPDTAFVTVAADQIYRLYVNGTFVGANTSDLVQGNRPHAYNYDITAWLRPGSNVLAIRVANSDGRAPTIRATLGMVHGRAVNYSGTDRSWQATTRSSLVYMHNMANAVSWTDKRFNENWPAGQVVAPPGLTPLLTVHPLLYERPLAAHWLSAGSGHEAYFVRNVALPSSATQVWLRIVADGTASVFINGNLWIVWDGSPPVKQHRIIHYLTTKRRAAHYRNTASAISGLALGIYDIRPYLHGGVNSIAVHVVSPGKSATEVGLGTVGAAMALDMLAIDNYGHTLWIATDQANSGWHAAQQPAAGWMWAVPQWPTPLSIGRPGASEAVYVPDSNSPRNTQVFPLASALLIALLCIVAVIGLWLLMAFLLRRYYRSRAEALALLSLAPLPALAYELLLIVLAPVALPPPFPYTWQGGWLLLALVALGYGMLWLYGATLQSQPLLSSSVASTAKLHIISSVPPTLRERLVGWKRVQLAHLRTHWALLLLMLVAVPLICYNLSYEPYWQDELTSYFAARGILAHGLPLLASGFLYPKGELYSYLLALSMALLGEQHGLLRVVSVLGYLISLPLLYRIGSYFFDRKIALLATAMLALSPFTLVWGRAVRMYELAQVLTILVVYLFFKALQERNRPHLIYLAVGCLIATYLSHEEVFIILPALLVGVLFASRDPAYRLPTVLYQKHWWIAATMGAACISCQLLIAKFSHPPVLGTDQSQQPLIQFTTSTLSYYMKVFFFPWTLGNAQVLLTANTLLAFAGCFWALHRPNKRARYCAIFFLTALLTLILSFTPTASRYIYPLLPTFYLLSAYALLSGLRTLLTVVRVEKDAKSLQQSQHSRLGAYKQNPSALQIAGKDMLSWLARVATLLICASVLILPLFPISSYNLLVSRVADLPYHRHFPDYDASGQYVRQHWRQGDIVVAISPAISILYYVGKVDYFFSVDRALYLFEHDGQITDTPTGSTPLLSQGDFNALLARHARIWVITDKGLYQTNAVKERRFFFPPDFHLVYAGYGSSVYLRGNA